jgi:hypothetical protein
MTTERIDDYDGITKVIQLYIHGSGNGDASKLKEAFHHDARMFGHIDGHRSDMPIERFFEISEGAPMNLGDNYRARILSVEQLGDAAVVVLAEDGCWGQVSFVDYFSLARFDGAWKIVNKTFVHTGGEMPPRG